MEGGSGGVCSLCGVTFPCLVGHCESVHSGPAVLVLWACGVCPFRAPSLPAFLPHANATDHSVRDLRPTLQSEDIERLTDSLAEVLGQGGRAEKKRAISGGGTKSDPEHVPAASWLAFSDSKQLTEATPPKNLFAEESRTLHGSNTMTQQSRSALEDGLCDDSVLSEGESSFAMEISAEAAPQEFVKEPQDNDSPQTKSQNMASPLPKANSASTTGRESLLTSPMTSSTPAPPPEVERSKSPERKRPKRAERNLFSPRRRLAVPLAKVDLGADFADKRLPSLHALDVWLKDVGAYLSVSYDAEVALGTEDVRRRCSGASEAGRCASVLEAWTEAGGEVSVRLGLHHSHPIDDFHREVRTLFTSLTTCSGQPRVKPRMAEHTTDPRPGRAHVERLDELRHSDSDAFLSAVFRGSSVAHKLKQLTNASNGKDWVLECHVDVRDLNGLKPLLETFVENTFQQFSMRNQRTGEQPGLPVRSLVRDYHCHLGLHRIGKKLTKKTGCRAGLRAQVFLVSPEEAQAEVHRMRQRLANVPQSLIKASSAPYRCLLSLTSRHNHPLDTAEALEAIQPLDRVRDAYWELFAEGFGPTAAIVRRQQLLREQSPELLKLAFHNPKAAKVDGMYKYWQKAQKDPQKVFLIRFLQLQPDVLRGQTILLHRRRRERHQPHRLLKPKTPNHGRQFPKMNKLSPIASQDL